jgi:hypothetical protein
MGLQAGKRQAASGKRPIMSGKFWPLRQKSGNRLVARVLL